MTSLLLLRVLSDYCGCSTLPHHAAGVNLQNKKKKSSLFTHYFLERLLARLPLDTVLPRLELDETEERRDDFDFLFLSFFFFFFFLLELLISESTSLSMVSFFFLYA
mmetsp:Transcript_16996/g.22053  ORF Transcript_16996/g.22053 Transcript_16996/m.22053 type:complete len:107 (+) Transcript_16996:120-440(+)